MKKIIIYQVFTRLFGNRNLTRRQYGSLAENGCGKMNDFNADILRRIHDMGITHVWFTGVIRHATATDYSRYGIPTQHSAVVKGKAGSPYAITDYYDIDPDLAVDVDNRMNEWISLVSRTHKEGMKVIMDFVPNHVAREYHSVCKPEGVRDLGEDDNVNMHFSTDNNFYYCWGQPFTPTFDNGDYEECPAKATGNDHFDNHPGVNDWYETVKLNYGIDYCDAGGRSEHFSPIPDTWRKMTDILLFWASMGVDAFRCDMAEMVPSAFWSYATGILKTRYPEIVFIGEVYDPIQYNTYIESGFDYLYDKVGMYDCLRDVVSANGRAANITNQWQTNDSIGGHMLYFLENHDEQRIASDFFAGSGEKAVPALIVSALLRDNPFMLYSGQEFGEKGMDSEGFSGADGRTTIFDYWAVDTLYRGIYDRKHLTIAEESLERIYKKVLHIASNEKAISEGLFFDLMYVNTTIADRQYAFLRKSGDEMLLVVANFDANDVECDILIPSHAFDFLNIGNNVSHDVIDLLSAESFVLDLVPDGFLHVNIPAYGGRVYKFGMINNNK